MEGQTNKPGSVLIVFVINASRLFPLKHPSNRIHSQLYKGHWKYWDVQQFWSLKDQSTVYLHRFSFKTNTQIPESMAVTATMGPHHRAWLADTGRCEGKRSWKSLPYHFLVDIRRWQTLPEGGESRRAGTTHGTFTGMGPMRRKINKHYQTTPTGALVMPFI